MNILLITVVIILAAGAAWGWKRGLLEGIIRIVSGILGILVIAVVAKGIGSFLQGSYANVLMAFTLLLVIRIIHRIVKFLTDTFKLVKAVPMGKLADKLAGMALGLVESVFVIWFLFLVIGSFDILGLNEWVVEQTGRSRFLSLFMYYYSEYFIGMLKHIL